VTELRGEETKESQGPGFLPLMVRKPVAMMKLTATAAIPCTIVVSTPAAAAEAVTVDTEVDV